MGAKKTAPSTLVLVAVRHTQKATGSIHQNSKMYSITISTLSLCRMDASRLGDDNQNRLVPGWNGAAV